MTASKTIWSFLVEFEICEQLSESDVREELKEAIYLLDAYQKPRVRNYRRVLAGKAQ